MLQINTEFLTNQLQKYFYTRDLTTLFHLTKKMLHYRSFQKVFNGFHSGLDEHYCK